MPVPTNQNSRAAAAARMAAAKGKSAAQFQKLKNQREERIKQGQEAQKKMADRRTAAKRMGSPMYGKAQGREYGPM